MPNFEVEVIGGTFYIEADDEQEAVEEALDQCDYNVTTSSEDEDGEDDEDEDELERDDSDDEEEDE